MALPPAFATRTGDVSAAEQSVVAAADTVLRGGGTVFHLRRDGLPCEPDWFLDPLTGRRAPRDVYAFTIPYRDEGAVGNIKFLWEPARHQTATVLAAAWWLTGTPAYAERAALQLRSWWRDNPFLDGVHWISGVEVGLRLLSWTWIRALLAGWEGCRALFDDNDAFVTQLYCHQRFLAAFQSRGSSANNHLLAELAGQAAAAAAFPWFPRSARWHRDAATELTRQAELQTWPDGFNREQAMAYHMFVFEILLAADLSTTLAKSPLPDGRVKSVLRRMSDALAGSLDGTGRPPRFGDSDDGRALLVDAPDADHAGVLMGAAAALVGPGSWWPAGARDSVRARLVTAVTATARSGTRPGTRAGTRPDRFPESGHAFLRAGEDADEIWVHCDSGPLGYLAIAAHGHADALAVEVRHGGVDILADPGTYCYHGEPEWRRFFKGTGGHNTLLVDGADQAIDGGPFLWLSAPAAAMQPAAPGTGDDDQTWQASHEGYRRLPDAVTHHRRVRLDGAGRTVEITDWIAAGAPHAVQLRFHLGPTLAADLRDADAGLAWPVAGGGRRARLHLPPSLAWRSARGETDPPLGWYSGTFGHREPATTLVGEGRLAPLEPLVTRLTFEPATTTVAGGH